MENGYEFIGIRSTPEIPRREHNTIYRSDQCRIATAMTVPLVAVLVGTQQLFVVPSTFYFRYIYIFR